MEWLGWHFLPGDRRLQFPPYTLVEPGQTLRVDPPLELCRWGLHASKRAVDALKYAPGGVVEYVRLSGEIVEGDDKACATERTTLWMANATKTLHEFACWCAEKALTHAREKGREPDPRSWAAVEAKRQWLRGEIDDGELEAAQHAAWNVTSNIPWDGAWDAARSAAYAAGWAAVNAAREAAANAARNADWHTSWAAERATQNEQLEKMLFALQGTEAEIRGC